MKTVAAAVAGCAAAVITMAPVAAADNNTPAPPGHVTNGPSQGPLELPDKYGARHVLRQDQTVGGANPDVPYGTNPFGKDEDTVIGGADPSTPTGTDPFVPFGTWQS